MHLKFLLFPILMVLSISVYAENCNEIAVQLATDLNNMHKKGKGIEEVQRRFGYDKDLLDLASLYMKVLIDAKPTRGWNAREYQELARKFSDMVCNKKN